MANRQGFGPGRGARGETASGLGWKWTPEEAAQEPPVHAPPLETAQRGTPCLPGQVPATGQWGPAATPAPITVWAPIISGTGGLISAAFVIPGQSSRWRPASWQRA